ncbi:MAG: ATP phosphoribosyltransferase [Victivallales bacterium]|nr:ATP phosphoribosyltransferase [Victivallales bacterium]
MLKIAIPNKGALSEGAEELLREAGYKCKRWGRELTVSDLRNEVEFIYLRPRDIAIYVGKGIVDLGITGRDLTFDSKADVIELLSLEFGSSSFYYAVPKEQDLTPDRLGGRRIATSYPNIVRDDLARRGIDATIIRLDGAVEISIRLGVADAIADVVESGMTLKEAGLKTVGEPIMRSEALLIGRDRVLCSGPEVSTIIKRMEGILMARKYAVAEYDIPKQKLAEACRVTPGIEAPTIAPLSNEDWVAVKAMILRKEINKVMDELEGLGAKGIIITDIMTCRI